MLGAGGHVWNVVSKEVAETQKPLKAGGTSRRFHAGNSFNSFRVGSSPMFSYGVSQDLNLFCKEGAFCGLELDTNFNSSCKQQFITMKSITVCL